MIECKMSAGCQHSRTQQNTINAIIREYIENKCVRIFYCKYVGASHHKEFCKEDTEKEVRAALRMDSTNAVIAIPNAGNIDEFVSGIESAFYH